MKIKGIKLNGYILPDNIQSDMESILDNTQLVEEGFALCSQDNIITKGKYFIGTQNGIIIDPRSCKDWSL